MEYRIARRRLVITMGGAGMALSGLAVAQGNNRRNPNRAGVANFVNGDATIADGDAQQQPLTSGTVVKQGQTIETAANGEVHIVLDDGGMLALRSSSRIQIERAQITGAFSDSLSMSLLRGAMRSITGWVGKFDHNNYQLRAATATVGIRGTDHEVAIIAEGEAGQGEVPGVHNWVHTGGTTLTNAGGHTDIEPGHAAWAPHNGQAPRAHQGIPNYLQKRKSAHEGRINAHAQHITEHIEKRMQKRGLIKPGETLQDAQQRHRAQQSNAEKESSSVSAEPEKSKPAANENHAQKAKRHAHK